MKTIFLKKAAAFVLSGVMMFSAANFSPNFEMVSEAAANKARVSVHDPSIHNLTP